MASARSVSSSVKPRSGRIAVHVRILALAARHVVRPEGAQDEVPAVATRVVVRVSPGIAGKAGEVAIGPPARRAWRQDRGVDEGVEPLGRRRIDAGVEAIALERLGDDLELRRRTRLARGRGPPQHARYDERREQTDDEQHERHLEEREARAGRATGHEAASGSKRSSGTRTESTRMSTVAPIASTRAGS